MFFSVTDKAIETFDILFLANINTIMPKVSFIHFCLKSGLLKIGHKNCFIRGREFWFLFK